MDNADIAQKRIDREIELALSRRAAAGPEPVGCCLNCGEPLRHPLRWCDADCRDDWERVHARHD